MPSRGRLGETQGPKGERENRGNNEYVAVNIHSDQQEQGNDKEHRELTHTHEKARDSKTSQSVWKEEFRFLST